MSLTPNTNKKIRANVDQVLGLLKLDLGNANYRDAFEAIQMGGGNEYINARLLSLGCMTETEKQIAKTVTTNNTLNNFLETI